MDTATATFIAALALVAGGAITFVCFLISDLIDHYRSLKP